MWTVKMPSYYKSVHRKFERLQMNLKEFTYESFASRPDSKPYVRWMVERAGKAWRMETKKLTPVRTGLLKASWYLTRPWIRGSRASIGLKNDVHYMLYVEYGHRGTGASSHYFFPGRFMMHRGKLRAKRVYTPIIRAHTRKLTKKLIRKGL